MRLEYPDLVWGAIASSGELADRLATGAHVVAVTHAQVNFPQYYDPIQEYGPEDCISALQSSIKVIDLILDLPEPAPTLLKGLFGLEELKSHADFADVISSPLGKRPASPMDTLAELAGFWQGKNWDPAVGSNGFQVFCDALTAGGRGSSIGLVRM
jgi:hypothetical protein